MCQVSRWYWKCRDCLSVCATESELALDKYRQPIAECGLCGGRFDSMGRVHREGLVHDRTVCACDERCTSAQGPSCNCKCGGENHGTGRVVSIMVGAGPVPVLKVPDAAKARVVADEYRAALAPLVAERDAISARKAAGWIERSAFDRWRELCHIIARAGALKTHANRMKLLRGYLVV